MVSEISLNGVTPDSQVDLLDWESSSESRLIDVIYSFANDQDEWFNLVLGFSNCLSMAKSLPERHPYQGLSERLATHFKNAIQISTRLAAGRNYTMHKVSGVEHLPIPAGVIDQFGVVVDINSAAEHLFSLSDFWHLKDGQLSCSHVNLLEHLKHMAASNLTYDSAPLYSDPSDSATVHITEIPDIDAFSIPGYYFCIQSSEQSLVNPHSLRQSYGLTEMETSVAVTLIKEVSTRKTAKCLGVKPSTVRDHLSNIYLKMGVKRKPEMVLKALQASMVKFSSKPSVQSLTSEAFSCHLQEHLSSIILTDGRRFSFSDISPPPGRFSEPPQVVVLMHSLMGSAFEIPPCGEAVLYRENIRLITPERPGYGNSDPLKSRTILSVCDDIKQVLDSLKITRCKIMGYSSGGCYALALAGQYPGLVESVSLVASLTRLQDIEQCKPLPLLMNAVLQGIKYTPFLMSPMMRLAVGHDLEHFYQQQLTYIRPSSLAKATDLSLLKTESYKRYSMKNFKQSLKQGVDIWAQELSIVAQQWPFELKEIVAPVQIWHGDCDDVIPSRSVGLMAKDLNVTHFNQIPHETHLMLGRYADRALEQLISV